MKKKYKILLITMIIIVLFLVCIIIYLKINPKIAVLCYHNVATEEEKLNFPDEASWVITKDNFEEHLKYLEKHHYKTLTMEEFYKWKKGDISLPYKSVLITFDDGFLSNYEYAFPLLKKYKMNATVFVVGKFIEDSNQTTWDSNIRTYMSKDILNIVDKEYPNIEIYSHSYNLHRDGAIEENIDYFENDIKIFNDKIKDVDVYCYPFGKYNNNMIDALKKSNYKLAFIYGPTKKEYRKASRKDNDYEIPRLNVSHGMPTWKFGLRLLMPF